MRFIPVPLPDAGPTSIGQYDSANITQDLGLKEGQHKFEEILACVCLQSNTHNCINVLYKIKCWEKKK